MLLSHTDFFHGPTDLVLNIFFNFQFMHGHFPFPCCFINKLFQLKDMVSGKTQGDASKGAGNPWVAVLKGRGHNPDGSRLIDAENNDEILPLILLSQIFDCFLGRKTYGAGGGSDKAGGGFIDHFSPAGQ